MVPFRTIFGLSSSALSFTGTLFQDTVNDFFLTLGPRVKTLLVLVQMLSSRGWAKLSLSKHEAVLTALGHYFLGV